MTTPTATPAIQIAHDFRRAHRHTPSHARPHLTPHGLQLNLGDQQPSGRATCHLQSDLPPSGVDRSIRPRYLFVPVAAVRNDRRASVHKGPALPQGERRGSNGAFSARTQASRRPAPNDIDELTSAHDRWRNPDGEPKLANNFTNARIHSPARQSSRTRSASSNCQPRPGQAQPPRS